MNVDNTTEKPKKSWVARHKILVGVGGALAGIIVIAAVAGKKSEPALASSGGNPSPAAENSSGQKVFKTGDVIIVKGKKIVISDVNKGWKASNEFIKPKESNQFVRLMVSVENESDQQVSVSSSDFKMQDSQGVIKDVDMMSSSNDDKHLSFQELAPKGKVSGSVIFEVPKNSTNLTLKYNSGFGNGGVFDVTI